jgi:hypothetical protein
MQRPMTNDEKQEADGYFMSKFEEKIVGRTKTEHWEVQIQRPESHWVLAGTEYGSVAIANSWLDYLKSFDQPGSIHKWRIVHVTTEREVVG